ncbi:MAG TPA: FmdB family zinc ribbon protein [Thermoanaerobaculia bacterium]|nr:FmdB family zinc ribbon protein [Thermoanaerobaculia bacterium]
MPIYEYQCLQCGRRSERLQRLDEPLLTSCPHCGGEVKKLFSAPAVQFKGSGWYVTDYAGRGKPSAAEGKDEKTGKADETAGKAEGKAAGAEKPEAKGGDTAKPAEKAAGDAKSGGGASSE